VSSGLLPPAGARSRNCFNSWQTTASCVHAAGLQVVAAGCCCCSRCTGHGPPIVPQGERLQYVLLAGERLQEDAAEDPLTAARAGLEGDYSLYWKVPPVTAWWHCVLQAVDCARAHRFPCIAASALAFPAYLPSYSCSRDAITIHRRNHPPPAEQADQAAAGGVQGGGTASSAGGGAGGAAGRGPYAGQGGRAEPAPPRAGTS
jgi:hypothetical protein